MGDTILDAMDRFRRPLDELTTRQRTTLLRTYESGWRSIQAELEALQAKVASAPTVRTISGSGVISTGVPPSWTFQQERYISLQNQVRTLVADVGQTLGQTALAAQPAAWDIATQEARAVGSSFDVPMGAWGTAPTSAFQAFTGATNTGPLRRLLDGFAATNGPLAGQYARDVLGAGLLRGRAAQAIARDLQAGLQTITHARALRIARTETLRAYREGVRQNYLANRNIVQSWQWRAAVENQQRPPCAACFAKHGSIHSLSEPMDSHPNCRCRMIPRRSPVQGFSPTDPVLIDREKAFAALPPGTQRRILGPTRLEMYRSGRVRLDDFATSRPRGVWGKNDATVRPLSELRNLSRQDRTLERMSDRLFQQSAAGEVEVSAALQRLAQQTGAKLEGFGFRLKERGRIAEKIQTDVLVGKGGIVRAGEQINDALRYTYTVSSRNYASSVRTIVQDLASNGYKPVKDFKNFWQSPSGYRGYHSLWQSPSGARFELQFHTPQSFAAKMRAHELYAIQRAAGTSAAQRAALQAEMDGIFAALRAPRGARSLPDRLDDFGPLRPSPDDFAAAIREVEDQLVQNRDFETAVAWDSTSGRIILDKRGETMTSAARAQVEFTLEERQLVRGSTFTHNHPLAWRNPYPDGTYPAGSSFSLDDVGFALSNGVGEMRAVSPGYRHILRPGSNFTSWTDIKDDFLGQYYQAEGEIRYALQVRVQEIQAAARRELDRAALPSGFGVNVDAMRAYQDALTRATIDASFDHHHLIWERLARRTGYFTYERIPR